jgi:hypothetical protein
VNAWIIFPKEVWARVPKPPLGADITHKTINKHLKVDYLIVILSGIPSRSIGIIGIKSRNILFLWLSGYSKRMRFLHSVSTSKNKG